MQLRNLSTQIFLVLVFILSLSINVNGQQDYVHVSGNLSNDSGKAITNAYIKISSKKNNLILAYFNLAKDSIFKTKLPFYGADTIVVTATHVGFQTTVRTFYADKANDSFYARIVMPTKTTTLDNVTVTAPPVWVRGDTTFHKASAFKEGDERRLKDLILKMPGFEIDENGDLLYKKKKVEKVMVDGEEVFADKVKLLINNFPIHAVDVVQALENQNNNPLFKGLKNENRVFLNLALNKAKLKAAFGNAELGLGTRERYLFNPVVFSIYGKLKMGYIGNANSIGDGIGWREELEQKPEQIKELENWLMRGQQLKTIGNFDNNRYITNNRISNNLQVNIPSSKTVKQKLEMFAITDRQQQQTFYQSSIYSGSVYVQRNDTNQITYKPLLLSAKYSHDWQVTDSSMLKTSFQYYYDGSRNRQLSIYHQQNNLSQTENQINNSWKRFNGHVEYTKRKSAIKAYRIGGSFSYNNNPQHGYGISDNWPSVFNIPIAYNRLNQGVSFANTTASILWEQTAKKGSRLGTLSFIGNWEQYRLSNKLLLASANQQSIKDTLLQPYSNASLYDYFSFKSVYQHRLNLLGLPLTIKPELGYLKATAKENQQKRSFSYPLYRMELYSKNELWKKVPLVTSVAFEQTSMPDNQNSNIVQPTDINVYRRFSSEGKPLKSLAASTGCSFNWPRSFNNSNIMFSFNRNYLNMAAANSLVGMVQYMVDSFVNQPLNLFSINTTSTINKVKTGGIYTFGGGINWGQGLLLQQTQLLKSTTRFTYLFVTAKFNMQKKYYISSSVHWFNSNIQYPLSVGAINNNVSNIRLLLRQRLMLGKRANFIVNTEMYNGNIGSNGDAVLFFMDAELNIGYPEKHLFFYVKAENLAKQKYYYTSSLGLLQQSLYQVPLVPTNIMVSFKYEL